LDKAFARVSDDLRTQYLLGYYPQESEPGKDQLHRVVVTIPRAAADEFNVRNKAGYYADTRLHLKWQHDLPTVVAPPLQDASAGRNRPGGALPALISDRQVIVNIKLRDGETVRGWIEYFDDSMLRLTREGSPICSSTSTRSAASAKPAGGACRATRPPGRAGRKSVLRRGGV
jgi:hypothetical protein